MSGLRKGFHVERFVENVLKRVSGRIQANASRQVGRLRCPCVQLPMQLGFARPSLYKRFAGRTDLLSAVARDALRELAKLFLPISPHRTMI